jgi:hypothetical protein
MDFPAYPWLGHERDWVDSMMKLSDFRHWLENA